MPCSEDDLCEFIRDHLSALLTAGGMDGGQVAAVLDDLEQSMRDEYGGEDHYIPAADKKQRNKMLLADWRTGIQVDALAKKYNMHVRSVYRVINQKPKTKKTCGVGLGTDEWVL